MAKATVTELNRLVVDAAGRAIQAADFSYIVRHQEVDFTAGVAQTPLAFHENTRFVRFQADSVCAVTCGADPTALVTDARFAADAVEFLGVAPGQKISCITRA